MRCVNQQPPRLASHWRVTACHCPDAAQVVSTHLLFGCFHLAAANVPIKTACEYVFVSPG